MPWVERYRTKTGRLRWRGRYLDAAGGKPSRTFDTKAAAARWSGEEESKVQRGQRTDPASARMRWGDWCDRWLPSKQTEPSTRRTDESTIRCHVRPRWGAVPLIAVARIDVQSWVGEVGRKVGPSTTRRAFFQLSASLDAAVHEGILVANPCRGVKLPTLPTHPARFLTDVEVGRIFYHLSGRWRVLVELLLGAGLRPEEAAGLHVARVDLAQLRLHVVETYDPRVPEMRGYPKSKRRRTVPLSPELAELLQAWLDRNPPAASCGRPHRGGKCPGGLLLVGEHGAALDMSNFDGRQWRDACERAGFYVETPSGRRKVTVRVYDLRHTYASRLVQQRVSLERVQLLLGHASYATSQIYAHLVPTDDFDEVRAALSTSVTAARAEVSRLRVV